MFSYAQLSAKTRPHRLQPTRFLYPWDFLGKNTGAGCHFLLPEPGIKLESLASPVLADGFFTTAPPMKTLAILIPGKINFKPKTVMKEKGHYIMKKVSMQQEDIIFVNIYAPNIEVVSLVAQMVKKKSVFNAGNPGLIPGSGKPPREGNGNPLQYSYQENPMDREAW